MASEATIEDKTFIIGKLAVFDQFHVFRRVTPILQPILLVFRETRGKLAYGDMFMAIAGPLASLSDADLDFVRDKCLAVVRLKEGDKSFPLMVNGVLMYQNLDMMTMLRLVWEVLMDPENLGPFITGLLVGLSKGEEAPPPTT